MTTPQSPDRNAALGHVVVGNCPTCNHFPTQFIAGEPQENATTPVTYRALRAGDEPVAWDVEWQAGPDRRRHKVFTDGHEAREFFDWRNTECSHPCTLRPLVYGDPSPAPSQPAPGVVSDRAATLDAGERPNREDELRAALDGVCGKLAWLEESVRNAGCEIDYSVTSGEGGDDCVWNRRAEEVESAALNAAPGAGFVVPALPLALDIAAYALREYADLQDMVAASGGTFQVRINGAYSSTSLRRTADMLTAAQADDARKG